MAIGKGKRLEDGKMVALDVKTGDRILFGKYSGNEIKGVKCPPARLLLRTVSAKTLSSNGFLTNA